MSEEKKKEQRKRRRRLSDEEKERFKRKGLLLKAIKFKRVTDIGILVCLLLIVGGAFLPIIQREQLKIAGWRVVLGRESPSGRHGLLADGTVYARLTASNKLAKGKGATVAPYEVAWYAYAFVGVYPLAALFVLFYLLDFGVSLGRPLPVASALYGLSTLGYVLLMVVWGGPFNEFRSYGLLSLLLGTFVLAFVSLLRLPNSSRKRRRMLRAAKRGEPLEPFFAPAEKKEEEEAEAPPVEAEKEKEPEAEPEEKEAQPVEAGEGSQAGEKEEPEPSEAAEPGEGEAPSEESEPEAASEDDSE